MFILCDLKDYNESKKSVQPVISTILGDVFCNKSCTVHDIINVISKAGADVVRTITTLKEIENMFSVILSSFSINLLAFYHEGRSLIGYKSTSVLSRRPFSDWLRYSLSIL